MPLDRAHLNGALRVMVPAFVIFFGAIGLNFAINPARLGLTPMLHYADQLMPLPAWGGLFLGCSIIMAVAMVRRDRDTYRFGLLVCFLSMGLWTGVAILGAFVQPVSFSAWAWPALIAAACYATNRSLERDRRGY